MTSVYFMQNTVVLFNSHTYIIFIYINSSYSYSNRDAGMSEWLINKKVRQLPAALGEIDPSTSSCTGRSLPLWLLGSFAVH